MTLRWTIARLGDVCQTGAGGTPLSTRKEYYEGGKIPWLVSGEVAQGEITSSSNFITDLGLNNSSARVFPEDTVLVAMYGATAGQVGILRFPAATNQAVCGILPNDNFIPKFMYYLFLSKKQELISQAAGNAQPNISQLKIKNTRVPVPPLPEQQRIVTILDNAFAGLATASANAEKNLTNARELFDNYVDSVFVAGGAGWIRRQIGELATTQYGLSGTLNGEGIGHKVFRMGEVQDGVLVDTGQMKFIDIDDAEFKQYRLNRGDVLFNRTNSSELVGKTGLFDIDGDYCFASYLVRVHFDPSKMDSRFASYLMNSTGFLTRIRTKAARSVSQANINATILRNEPIDLPGDVGVQSKLANTFLQLSSQTKRLQAFYDQKMLALARLKQAILEKAFSGELAEPPSRAISEAAE